jgi:hypothetical protein
MRRGLTAPDRLPPAYSIALAAVILALDSTMAPSVDMPGLYLLPVIYAAWYGGRAWGLALSLIPFGRVFNLWGMGADEALYAAAITAAPRALAFMAIALWLSSVAESQRALKREVDILHGLLPICAHCKKIRDDGTWQPVEKFIQDRSEAVFTHGVCDACMSAHYADLDGPIRRVR